MGRACDSAEVLPCGFESDCLTSLDTPFVNAEGPALALSP